MMVYIYINGSSIHHAPAAYTKYEDVQRKTLGNIDFKGNKMKGNFKYSRFNDLEQQIQIESHKINVECIFFKHAVCTCDTLRICTVSNHVVSILQLLLIKLCMKK